jgi:hypothetical protein
MGARHLEINPPHGSEHDPVEDQESASEIHHCSPNPVLTVHRSFVCADLILHISNY